MTCPDPPPTAMSAFPSPSKSPIAIVRAGAPPIVASAEHRAARRSCARAPSWGPCLRLRRLAGRGAGGHEINTNTIAWMMRRLSPPNNRIIATSLTGRQVASRVGGRRDPALTRKRIRVSRVCAERARPEQRNFPPAGKIRSLGSACANIICDRLIQTIHLPRIWRAHSVWLFLMVEFRHPRRREAFRHQSDEQAATQGKSVGRCCDNDV